MANSKKAKPASTSRNRKSGALARPRAKARPSESGLPADAKSASTAKRSKQDTVLGMLRQPKGATISAIMSATTWQQHSVRGFLAAIVRKKLKLKLKSEMVGEERVYSIPKAGAGS
jgi:uncharacterized protein DUF3489